MAYLLIDPTKKVTERRYKKCVERALKDGQSLKDIEAARLKYIERNEALNSAEGLVKEKIIPQYKTTIMGMSFINILLCCVLCATIFCFKRREKKNL